MEKKIVLEIEGLGQIITTEDKIDLIHDMFGYATTQAWDYYKDTGLKTFYDQSGIFNDYACEMHKYLKGDNEI